MESWVGLPMARRLSLSEIRIEKISDPDSQGNVTYTEKVENNCRVFWAVDADGIISAWSSDGKACKYYVN
jgi:hypothetical protein